MRRPTSDIEADPSLRPEFIEQPSFDEFYLGMINMLMQHEDWQTRAEGIQSGGSTVGHTALRLWSGSLHPDTTVNETLYLSGYRNVDRRRWVGEQQLTKLQNAVLMKYGLPRNYDAELRTYES